MNEYFGRFRVGVTVQVRVSAPAAGRQRRGVKYRYAMYGVPSNYMLFVGCICLLSGGVDLGSGVRA